MRISPVNEDRFIDVTVKNIDQSRKFTLLHSETPLCQKRLGLRMPRTGAEYIQISLSGSKENPFIFNKGFIASDDFQRNRGFIIGSSGSLSVDSGCAVFHPSLLELYGIGTARLTKVHKVFQEKDAGSCLNDLKSSYICPPFFIGFQRPPAPLTEDDILDIQTSAWGFTVPTI